MRVSAIVVCALALSAGSSGFATAQGAPTVVDTIFVGHEPTDIGINPLTGGLYVSNEPSRSVKVVDTRLGEVMDAIWLGLRSGDLAVNALTNRIYVSARTDLHNSQRAVVAVIDGETHTLFEPVTVGFGRGEVIVDPFRNLVFSINSLDYGMRVIDGVTNSELQWMHGPLCQCIGSNPLTPDVFVSDRSERFFAVSDPTRRERIIGATSMAVGPMNDRVYVTQGSRNQITVLDGAWIEAPVIVPVGNGPQGVATNPMTGRAYVANSRSGTVSVVEGGTVIATVEVGGSPRRVTVDPLTELVYVANTADGTVYVIEDANPAASPERILVELVGALMVDAGGDADPLQDAMGFIVQGAYDKAAQSLLAFSDEIVDRASSTEYGEKLAATARAIILRMIGN